MLSIPSAGVCQFRPKNNFSLIAFLCGLLPCTLIAGAAEDPGASQLLPSVILLGDSIRMNYQAVVSEAVKGKAVVWSPADNCGDTTYMLRNLERWVSGKKPRLIHINVGLHDMFLGAKSDKPRHTLKTYEKNLRAIFVKIEKLTDAKIVFALTTAVNEKRQADSETYGRVVRRNADIEVYNAKAREVAKQMDIPVNDLNAFMKKNDADKIIGKSDGVHLSKEGRDLLGDCVAQVILTHLSE